MSRWVTPPFDVAGAVSETDIFLRGGGAVVPDAWCFFGIFAVGHIRPIAPYLMRRTDALPLHVRRPDALPSFALRSAPLRLPQIKFEVNIYLKLNCR